MVYVSVIYQNIFILECSKLVLLSGFLLKKGSIRAEKTKKILKNKIIKLSHFNNSQEIIFNQYSLQCFSYSYFNSSSFTFFVTVRFYAFTFINEWMDEDHSCEWSYEDLICGSCQIINEG